MGLSTHDKIKIVTKDIAADDAIFTANQEEISYILNKRDFSKNYSSSLKKQKLLITKEGIFDADYLVNGMLYRIFPDTKTEQYVFGISWIDDVGWGDSTDNNHDRDIQTWFAADPTVSL